jgi:hypothetical protein
MEDVPMWITWDRDDLLVVSDDKESWDADIAWLLSAPHLYPDEEKSKGYGAVELWIFGLSMIVKALLTIREQSRELEQFSDYQPSEISDRPYIWMEKHEAIAQKIVYRTINILNAEYINHELGAVDDSDHSPTPTPMVEPSITRSMAQAARVMQETPADGTRKRRRSASVVVVGPVVVTRKRSRSASVVILEPPPRSPKKQKLDTPTLRTSPRKHKRKGGK